MEIFKCQMCQSQFEVTEKELKGKVECPCCGSPNVAKTIDKLSSILNNPQCGTDKKTA